jgi:hypothetical protein
VKAGFVVTCTWVVVANPIQLRYLVKVLNGLANWFQRLILRLSPRVLSTPLHPIQISNIFYKIGIDLIAADPLFIYLFNPKIPAIPFFR